MYAEFIRDPTLLDRVLAEVAPESESIFASGAASIAYLLQVLTSQTSVVNQIGIITKIRKLVSLEDAQINEICTQTKLIDLCARIISFANETYDFKVMKLEAYWILTNLCMGTADEV
jgi:hypothetical protein